MTSSDFAAIAFYLLGSVGGAGFIFFALSSWLGKVWAQRIMDQERAKHERDLAELRNKLEHQTQTNLKALETDLSIFKEHHLRGLNDKLATYRMAVDLVAEILGDFDKAYDNGQLLSPDKIDAHNRQRMRLYGYLSMVASQDIMDAQDRLIDHLLLIVHKQEDYVWKEVRALVLDLINQIRKDLKFDAAPIAYNGKL